MAAPIGPGDWVECIESRTLTVGALYRVRDICAKPGRCGCHGESPFGLRLFGAPCRAGHDGWCGLNFRPIYRPSADFIASLNAPPKAAPRQPTLPTRTPEVVGAGSRDEHGSLGFAVSVAALRMLEGG